MLSLEPGSVTSDMARQRGQTGQLRPDVSAAERKRERERSKSIEVGGSRIRKLETPDYQKGVDMLTSLSPNSQSSSFN